MVLSRAIKEVLGNFYCCCWHGFRYLWCLWFDNVILKIKKPRCPSHVENLQMVHWQPCPHSISIYWCSGWELVWEVINSRAHLVTKAQSWKPVGKERQDGLAGGKRGLGKKERENLQKIQKLPTRLSFIWPIQTLKHFLIASPVGQSLNNKWESFT